MAARRVGARALLFSERSQQLSALNDTALCIWDALAQGRSCEEAAHALERMGAAPDDAAAFVRAAAAAWIADGSVTPLDVIGALAHAPHARQTYCVGGFDFELAWFGDADPHTCVSTFGHLASEHATPRPRIDVVGQGGSTFLFEKGVALGAYAPNQLAPALKAHVTELYCRSVERGFLLHGGLLRCGERRVLLSGAPGAGKTTLTLALAAAGCAYGGDDIVHVRENGLAEGAPFAAAVKHGAWRLLEARYPDLESLPCWERSDGKRVRYLAPSRRDKAGPGPLHAIILLARADGVTARCEPVDPLDALCVLLDSAFSRRGAVSAAALEAFAATLAEAKCVRLVYDDLDGAVAAVKGLVDA